MAQDIGLLLRGLGASFSQQVPQFRQEMAQEQELARQQQLLAEQQSQRQRQAQIQDVELQQKVRAAGYQDAFALGNLLKGNNIEAGLGLLEDRLNTIEQLGINLSGDPTMMIYEDLRLAATGDAEALHRAQMRTALAVAEGIDRGELQLPEAKLPEIIPNSSIIDGQVVTRDAQGNIVATRPQGLQVAPPPDATLQAETTEARNYIRSNVSDINKNLTELTTQYDKIIGLEPQMRDKNRSAINAGIMSLARIISPGVVTDQDAAAYSGANTNVGAMFEFLSGKGVDVADLIKIYDPANPNTFDTDALLSVARSVTASSIPAQLARFEDQKTIANQYDLGSRFENSFLASDSNLMRSATKILDSLNTNQSPMLQQPRRVTFRSLEEAESAVNLNALPIGTKVDIVDASGRVVDSFTVEE